MKKLLLISIFIIASANAFEEVDPYDTDYDYGYIGYGPSLGYYGSGRGFRGGFARGGFGRTGFGRGGFAGAGRFGGGHIGGGHGRR